MSNYFSNLEKQKYMNLTTFRKTGAGVTTPVWFAQDGVGLVVITPANSGKAKRIRNNPRVQVGPSDVRGNSLGESVQAQARIMQGDETKHAEPLLAKKYGLRYQFFSLQWRLAGIKHLLIEITPSA